MRPMEVKKRESKKEAGRPGKMEAMWCSFTVSLRETGWSVGMAPKAFFGELTGETVPDLSRNTLAWLAGISGEWREEGKMPIMLLKINF